MDNNIQENVIEAQDNNLEENKGKKPSKKVGFLLGAVALVAVIVGAVVLIIGGLGKGKLEIEGKTYSYSAEKGIVDVEEVCDGVAVYNGISGTFYSKSGETQEISGMDVLGGKYPVAYHGTMRIGDNNLALTNYNVYGEFKTQFGATHESTKAELDKKDFVAVGGVYSIVTTNKGAIDWKDIEKDYDKMVSTNSFKEIEYIDSALLVGSDYATIAVASDDVKMLIDMYSVSNSEGVKDALMLWLARGKAVDMLLDGDVDYVVEEGVYYQEGRVNTLYVRMYTSVADAEKIKESMGITK